MQIAVLVVASILLGVILHAIISKVRANAKARRIAEKEMMGSAFKYLHDRMDTLRGDLGKNYDIQKENGRILDDRIRQVEDFLYRFRGLDLSRLFSNDTCAQANSEPETPAKKKPTKKK